VTPLIHLPFLYLGNFTIHRMLHQHHHCLFMLLNLIIVIVQSFDVTNETLENPTHFICFIFQKYYKIINMREQLRFFLD
jgi:hypothetical protein